MLLTNSRGAITDTDQSLSNRPPFSSPATELKDLIIMTQQSLPVPCMNCGQDIKLDYPKGAMAAIAGICATCEHKAIEQQKINLARQIQPANNNAVAIDEAELINHSQLSRHQIAKRQINELKRRFHRG